MQDIYRDEGPGVAFIQAEGVSESSVFGQEEGTATGSGFVVDEDGTIVTNAHVVDGADEVTVSFEEGGDSIDAEVKGVDPDSDLAVLKIDPGDGLGTRDVIIGNIDDERYDDVYNVDLRLEKILNIQVLQIALSADVFNVLNEDTVLQRNGRINTTPSALNQIREIQSPRVVRLGARVSF